MPRGHTTPPAAQNNQRRTQPERPNRLAVWEFIFVVIVAIATSFAAYFTGQQWATADDTEKRQLRAYVGITPGDVDNFGQPSGQGFTIFRKNYGQTPAYDVGFSSIGADIIRNGTDYNPSSNCTELVSVHGLTTMNPGADMRFTQRALGNFPATQLDMVKNNGGFLLVYYGNACYHDVWGHVHYTNYCFIFQGPSMKAQDAHPCLHHNDSD